ncbi:hypothetical protein ST47_g309 [Ascochyta rabiei]|uniref:Uncharacterized protein n=1 Tax=Didymella rabiei TaxID=5454 RepID=A0A163MAQ0_DIDRA|nr:hypothetical protein ST47_g309 [Ascochyta rabiei]
MHHLTPQYRCIGKGFCGSVWTLENSEDDEHTAIKREDSEPDRSLTKDYNMHVQDLQSRPQHPPTQPLSILRCHTLLQQSDPWWQAQVHRFRAGY